MQIDWTIHGRQRALQRGIAEADVIHVLKNAHTSLPGRPSGTCYIGTTPRGDTLQVCIVGVLNGEEPIKIKTVFIKGDD